jgi:dipeptidase D
MYEDILKLNPSSVWKYFVDVLQIPRCSKHEEKIIDYLKNFGKKYNLETIQDEVGNILIRKPATNGMEAKPWVCMQSHIDMVCEKNSDVNHDFAKDPIKAYVKNGWVHAEGTTLGADDGIGVAIQLAILADDDIDHGPIECLFTIDEETGLTGAFGLKNDLLKSKILLNLDSEDDGELFFGCAGGMDTVIKMPVTKEKPNKNNQAYSVSVKGLSGGHSGDDINKGRGNAVKILNRLLWTANNEGLHIQIADFNGGNLRNAIARESIAIVYLPAKMKHEFENLMADLSLYIKDEFKVTEPKLEIEVEKINYQGDVLSRAVQNDLLNSIYACPHGVIKMSDEIDNFVETSTNLAAVKFKDDHILITTSQRSSVESEKFDIANMVRATFNLAGCDIEHSDGYPGWAPNPNSEIIALTRKSYQKLFDEDPKVLAIHAGLECGLIGHTYPGMDMVSYGPTIRGAHSPDERIEIRTVEKFWDLTIDVLKNI